MRSRSRLRPVAIDQRCRWHYVLRTLLTPRELRFRALAVPDGLHCAYLRAKLADDYLLLPGLLLTKRLLGRAPVKDVDT